MITKRFEDIFKCIHLVDNNLVEARDELCEWNDDQVHWKVLTHLAIHEGQYGLKIWCLVIPSSSMCKKWKCILVHVMRMLNLQLDTRLSMGWWMGTKTSLTMFWDLLKVRVHATRTYKIDWKVWPNALTIDPKRGWIWQLWYHMHAFK